MSRLKNFKRCCLAFAVSQAISMPVEAALITVTSNADTSGANSSSCTLRDAILSANTNSAVSGSSCTAGAGDDIIEFSDSLANLTITLSLGELPEITSTISINGSGQIQTEINGNSDSGIFDIDEAGSLTLSQLTLKGGARDYGGAIHSTGSLTILDSKLTNNSASGSGGAIFSGLTDVYDSISSPSVTIANSIISNNSAGANGGGLFGASGGGLFFRSGTIASISRSLLLENSAGNSGGGIHLTGSSKLTLSDSTVTENDSGGNGGGLTSVFELTYMNVNNSTITNNTAANDGGGIFAIGDVFGYASTAVANSILSGNEADNKGDEGSGAMIIENSLIGSSSITLPQAIDISGSRLVITENNIIATNDGDRPSALTDILLPLANNGGPTLTHALPEFSPAIDAGNQFRSSIPRRRRECSAADQRGEPRNPIECDLGAFETTGLAADPRATDNLNPIIPPILDLLFEE